MKILAIRGKNLASLAGDFSVDFTAEPLRSAGIFAITGATGSGKSTLLDALCLALFDKTPRTEGSSDSISISDTEEQNIGQKDPRSILRRGTTQGYAEVEFKALDGYCYRSRWSVARARDKITGKLKIAEIRLFRLDNQEEIPGTKTEVLFRIQELLGMNFEQFTRSVLLAQNDFSTFLKAKQNEKAELLEKLTGTEIYSRISKAIYARTKDAEEEWKRMRDRIADIELLPDETVKQYVAEQNSVRESLALLQEQRKGIEAKLNWIKNRQSLSVEKENAQNDLVVIRKELLEARPRFDYLQRIDAIQPIRESFLKLKTSEKRQSENQSLYLTLQRQQFEIAERYKTAEAAYRQNEAQLKEIEDVYVHIEPQLRRARDLDILIEKEKELTGKQQVEIDKIVSELKSEQVGCDSLQREIATTETRLKEIEEWFASHDRFKAIIPHTSLILNLIRETEIACEQKKSNEKTLETLRKSLETEESKLNRAKGERESLEKYLPKEIIQWRSQLVEGAPCPVCGSTHHPITQHADISEELLQSEKLEELKENVDKKILFLSDEIGQISNSIERCRTLIQNYEVSYQNAYTNIAGYFTAFPDWENLWQSNTLERVLKETSSLWGTNQELFLQLSEMRNSANEKLKAKRILINRLTTNRDEKRALLSDDLQRLSKWSEERKGLFNGRLADDIQQKYEERKTNVAKQLEASRTNLNEIVGKQEHLKGVCAANRMEHDRFSQEIETERRNIEAWLIAFNGSSDFTLSAEELPELLSRSPEWISREQEQLEDLRRRENSGKATLTERENRLKLHESNNPGVEASDGEERLTKQIEETGNAIMAYQKRDTEITVRLQTHDQNSGKAKQFAEKLKQLESTLEKWNKLNELLGSQSGDKFKKIAQGYTLDILLGYANRHLHELSKRYELQRIPDTLGLQISDLDMGGEIRSVHSLSGGESFLISLALALGLSSVSSNRMQVESLFIDEGFGSLDTDTLRIAMDALERLQTGGRKIGVISHVQEMTERIAVQIRVEKTGNGKSRISITE